MATKGGLQPAKIISEQIGTTVECLFNPKEYTLTKSNTWESKAQRGSNTPKVKFKQGGSQTLKLQLYFDTLEDKADVRKYTDKLWKMMAIDESTEHPQSKKSAPPICAFQWGTFYFEAIIKTMTQKFTLFLADGTPVRTTVDITFEQLIDKDDYAGGTATADYRPAAEAANVDNPKSMGR